MTRALFLAHLKDSLSGMPEEERAEIVADYEAHFADGLAAGRSETDIEASLGDPTRLAKELSAEAGLKSWEKDRNPKNFMRASLGLFGLATLDLFLLLPAFIFLVVVGALLFAFTIVGIVGVSLAIKAILDGASGLPQFFAGLGLIALAVGSGALILMLLGVALRLFGRYGRLHYQLLETTEMERS
jgi:uncharacterized membrane protein